MVKRKYKRRLKFAGFLVALVITTTAVCVRFLENWSWIDSFYFSVVTFTTIGYGDLTPSRPLTRLVLTFLLLVLFGVFIYAFDILSHMRFHTHLHKVKTAVAKQIESDQVKKVVEKAEKQIKQKVKEEVKEKVTKEVKQKVARAERKSGKK